ncbi:MAG TPA: antitoxin [Thermoanaerobaculia bacterium]|nr:antitoxin [Thermoanaerobaculia bacterium]
MSKRLQVLLEESELREIRRSAKRQRMTVAEWVRQALRLARRNEPRSDAGKKLQVVRAAAEHSFPTADIGEMLDQIEQGYLASPPR